MIKNILTTLCLLVTTTFLFADPPEPPIGKRWVMNPHFSDEFNGTQLDATKWLDHHPTWKGREPGLFMPSQVSVANGYLQIRGEKMEKDTIVHAYGRDLKFNIKGGAVVSKKSVFLGYYECRAKAAATTMSTTFWFSGKGGDGPKGCDQYSQEWDIQECIGREGDFNGKYFAKGMHANAHYWHTDCDKKKHDYRAEQVIFKDEELASANFHTYGGWWHDETMASLYYDNGEPKYQKFYNKISDKPFDKPMYMRLVCETYPFPWIELPNDEELADPNKNVVYYDWVRGYELVDATEANATETTMEQDINLYYEDIMFKSVDLDVKSAKNVNIPLSYKANQKRNIHFLLKDADGKKVADALFVAHAGYANLEFDFNTKIKLKSGQSYTLVAHIRPLNSTKKEALNTSAIILNVQ